MSRLLLSTAAGTVSPVRGQSVGPNERPWCDDGHAAFLHQFFDVAIAQGIAEIPADGADDGFSLKVAPIVWGSLYLMTSGSWNRTL